MPHSTSSDSCVPLPIFLDLRGRACLVIGGGEEAALKAPLLVGAGARVRLLAPAIHENLDEWVETGRIEWLRGDFHSGLLDDVWFVLSTLADPGVNARLAEETGRRRIFLNVVDQTRFCSAIWPAVVRRPPVTVAISTGGASPGLAGYLRRRVERMLPREVGDLATWLRAWRVRAAGVLPDARSRFHFWRGVMAGPAPERFLEGARSEAERLVGDALAEAEAGPKEAAGPEKEG